MNYKKFKDNPAIDEKSITAFIIVILLIVIYIWVEHIHKMPRNIIINKQGIEIYGNYSCIMNNLYIGKKINYDSIIVLVPNTYCDNSKSKPRTISGKY